MTITLMENQNIVVDIEVLVYIICNIQPLKQWLGYVNMVESFVTCHQCNKSQKY